MCVPLIAVGMVMMAASAAMSAASQAQQGRAAQEAANANAKQLKDQAQSQRESAAYDAQLLREQYGRTAGSGVAAFGASGVSGSSGTPLDVLSQSTYQGERDALNTLYGGELSARQSYGQAAISRQQGAAAAQAGYMGAGGTILGAAGNMMTMGAGSMFGGAPKSGITPSMYSGMTTSPTGAR